MHLPLQLVVPHLIQMQFLDCGRKSKYPERTYADTVTHSNLVSFFQRNQLTHFKFLRTASSTSHFSAKHQVTIRPDHSFMIHSSPLKRCLCFIPGSDVQTSLPSPGQGQGSAVRGQGQGQGQGCPVGDTAMLDGLLQVQDAPPALCFIFYRTVFPT